MDREDHQELLRARQRLHHLESTVVALQLRLEHLTETVAEAKPVIAELEQAEKVRIGVAQVRFSGWQRLALGATVVSVLANLALQLAVKL